MLLVPLRDPSEVWKSWTRRIGTEHEIALGRFCSAWATLDALDSMFDLTAIPIDLAVLRDQELNRVADVSWDWSVKVGHEELVEQDIEMPSADEIYALPIVKQFYERHLTLVT